MARSYLFTDQLLTNYEADQIADQLKIPAFKWREAILKTVKSSCNQVGLIITDVVESFCNKSHAV